MINNPDKYWASLEPRELRGHLSDKIENYYDYIAQTLLPLWRTSYRAYNAAAFTNGKMYIQGANEEYLKIEVSQYRNLVDHSITITLNQLPSWEPRAVNGDVKSQKQCLLAKGLLDYYMREYKLQQNYLKECLLYASLYGEGFMVVDWDATSGEVYKTDPISGIKQFAGDVKYSAYGPVDVIRDPALYKAQNNQWYIIREFVNKYDLVAKYATTGDQSTDNYIRDGLLSSTASSDPSRYIWAATNEASRSDDIVELYTFYHARTPAIPQGRKTVFTENVILTDGVLPTEKYPVYKLSPGTLDQTTFGYTNNFDLLPLQQMINILYSIITTNQEAHGVGNIVSPRGAGTQVTDLYGGKRLIEFDGEVPPSVLNFLQTQPEVFKFIEVLERVMETLAGVNATARGNPEASLKSGAALALVQSMAVQFMMGLQASYISILEDVGTATINYLREYAAVPRVAMIVGKNKRSMMKEFTSDDLQFVNRVQVDAGNPLNQTIAGRVQKVTTLIEAGVQLTANDIIQVMETGQLDSSLDPLMTIMTYIDRENEMILDGEEPVVLFSDDDYTHLLRHIAMLSDESVRTNPEVMEIATRHIMKHGEQNPDALAKVVGKQLGQSPQGQPQPSQQGVQQAGQTAQAVNDQNQSANALAAEMQPSLPNPPKNAMTGEPAQLPPGAAVKQ